ncbi:MAG: hypothetical protein LUH07_05135 [Lachnospiraceae bacterium]|nr:hypothetical protein [Lachnospiraceae bacterium]
MNTGMKRAAVVALSTSLMLTSLAGCSKQEEAAFDADATIMTVNDEEVSAGLVKFAVHYSQAQVQEMYDYYFGDDSFSYEYTDGYTIGDMVKESALSTIEELILARQHMDEYDVSLTEEEETAISEAASAFMEANEEDVLEEMSATQEIVEEYLTLMTIETKMETEIGAGVDTEVSDEEAAQRRVEYVYVVMETEDETEEETETETETEAAESETAEETAADTEEETAVDTESETALLTGNTAAKTTSSDETDEDESETDTEAASEDETEEASEEDTETETETETEDPEVVAAMEEAYAKAEQIIALVEDGMDLEEAAAEIDEDLSVNEITFGADSSGVVENLITSTEGLEDDTLVTEPVEATSGYYVVRVISAFDEEATEAEKEDIVEERIEEAISDLFTEWEEDSEISTDEDVLATITFDFNLSQYVEETESETEIESESETGTETEEESESESEEESETAEETESESEEATETETE